MNVVVIAILAGVAFFVVLTILMGLKIIQQSETMVIERLGKYSRTLPSGINIIWPIIDKPRSIRWRYVVEAQGGLSIVRFKETARIDLRETVYDFPRQNVITKDNVVIEINALLYFQITDPKCAVYEIANLPDAIEKLTQTTLRNVLGEMDLDETLTSRDTINSKLRAILDEATDKWGVKVNRVELQDINPPVDIRDAMEKQMRAERDRRAAILEAEGKKKAAILEAEGCKEAEINKAEGEKMSRTLVADGEAEALLKVAQAEASAIDLLSRVMGGDPTKYIIAVRYIDALKDMVTSEGARTIFLPYEATGILGSLGGIKELFGSDGSGSGGGGARRPIVGTADASHVLRKKPVTPPQLPQS